MGLFSRLATRPVYNTRAVVLRTGVPADTFRAWERRYGLPAPARSAGNHRLYSDRDVAVITWLRDQTRSGLTISQAINLFKNRETSPLARETSQRFEPSQSSFSSETPVTGTALTRYSDALVDALIAYDSRTATQVLEEVLALIPVEEVCLAVLQPALYEIGDRWHRGEILISGEHFATSFAVRKLGSLFSVSRPEHGRGPVVATCLEGELHEAGLLMTCLFLSRRGVRVIYLGPNLPTEDLVDTIQEIRPPLVLLSASTPAAALDLRQSSRAIKLACAARGAGANVPEIGFGGKVFLDDPHLQDGIDGIFCGKDAEAASLIITEVLDKAKFLTP
ncbi:MAG: B12-binding domain-containing protein [Chloroflexia bacterium]|nr:B12-binding domain-containing protein [Chloroflexia bacterium]